MRFPFALQLALFVKRRDSVQLATCAVLAAALGLGAFVLPNRQVALDRALAKAEGLARESARAPAAKPAAEPEDRLLAFRRALGTRQETERHVETLLAIARDNKLLVRKAEYRSAYSKPGQYHTYQVTIPFQSGYEPVRAFCDEVLRALPFASIDAVQFSRTAVDVTDLEAKIVLTFFLAESDLAAGIATPSKSSRSMIPREAIIR